MRIFKGTAYMDKILIFKDAAYMGTKFWDENHLEMMFFGVAFLLFCIMVLAF